jgi:hypothetical protein
MIIKLLIRIVQKMKRFADGNILMKYIRKPWGNINLLMNDKYSHKQQSTNEQIPY